MFQTCACVRACFTHTGVKLVLNSRVASVGDSVVNVVDKGGQTTEIRFGACVWATGVAMNPLVKQLQAKLPGQNHFRYAASYTCDTHTDTDRALTPSCHGSQYRHTFLERWCIVALTCTRLCTHNPLTLGVPCAWNPHLEPHL